MALFVGYTYLLPFAVDFKSSNNRKIENLVVQKTNIKI